MRKYFLAISLILSISLTPFLWGDTFNNELEHDKNSFTECGKRSKKGKSVNPKSKKGKKGPRCNKGKKDPRSKKGKISPKSKKGKKGPRSKKGKVNPKGKKSKKR